MDKSKCQWHCTRLCPGAINDELYSQAMFIVLRVKFNTRTITSTKLHVYEVSYVLISVITVKDNIAQAANSEASVLLMSDNIRNKMSYLF